MNPIIHHFRKEFAYLRLRWFGFLALLGFDLAVNLEWLLSMRAGVATPGWLAFLPVVVLLSGLSLLLSSPEDRPGTDRSFISTRPLTAQAYWMSRVLIWLMLIVLPVVLQNGLYLVVSGRPIEDVMRGMWERLCFAAGFSGWLLPALALWRKNEVWKALLLVGLVLVAASKALDISTAAVFGYLSYYQQWPGLAAGWALFGILSAGIAWRHLQSGWRFRNRLLMSVSAAILGLLLARFWVLGTPEATAQDQALVRELSPKLKVDIPLNTTRFHGFERYGDFAFTATPETATGTQGVHVAMSVIASEVGQGNVKTNTRVSSVLARWTSFDSPQSQVYRGDTNLRDFFPSGTLFLTFLQYPKWSQEGSYWSVAHFEAPYPAADKPLHITSHFNMEWYQRDLAIDLPVKVGAKGWCEDARWEILGIAPASGPQPGALTIRLRIETRSHWDAEMAALSSCTHLSGGWCGSIRSRKRI